MSTEMHDRPSVVDDRTTRPARLVGIELRRLWWRRLTRYGLLTVAALVAFGMYGTWKMTQPPSPSDRAFQDQAYHQALRDFSDQVAGCRTAAEEAQRTGGPGVFECDRIPAPSAEMFGPPVATFGGLMPDAVKGTATGSSFLLFLIGASFVAAEFRSGSMATWLTFEPRRLRVAASKLVATGLGALLAGIALSAFTALGVWVVCLLNGPDTWAPEPSASLSWLVVRGRLMMTAAGVGGATIGFLVRSTAAVVGVVTGYAFVLEGIIASSWPTWQPWLIQLNVRAWLEDGARYVVRDCQSRPAGGLECSSSELTLPLSHAWVYLLALGTALVIVAVMSFRRRDVA